MIPILLLVTATFRPAHPTVGDLITIDFQKPVTLARSPDFEIVSQHGNRVVVRTFKPHALALSGRAGDQLFRGLPVPVYSVLKPRDGLVPAPLEPPVAEPYPRAPFVAIGAAALLALLAWAAAWMLHRRAIAARRPQPVIPPAERFRKAVSNARSWAQLADAVRDYLASTTELGKDLTTTEVIARSGSAVIADVLRQGDLEKFSPWGARPGDFAALKTRALELIPEEKEAAA